MKRFRMAIAMACLIGLASPTLAAGRGGGQRGGSRGGHGLRGGHGHGHGHWHGRHFGGPRFFFGGAFGWPYYYPWYYGPYVYAPPIYAYPYPYPSYPYAYPYAYPSTEPDDDAAASSVPRADEERGKVKANAPTSEEAMQVSYGLVQLRGIPDGAEVDLDGRFWMQARDLDQRWLALPRGRHTITVRAEDRDPVERTVDVDPGKNLVVRI